MNKSGVVSDLLEVMVSLKNRDRKQIVTHKIHKYNFELSTEKKYKVLLELVI